MNIQMINKVSLTPNTVINIAQEMGLDVIEIVKLKGITQLRVIPFFTF